MLLDTGFNSTMDGRMEDAVQLGLTLTDVSHRKLKYYGVVEQCPLQYLAQDVPLVIFGREHRGTFYVCPFKEV